MDEKEFLEHYPFRKADSHKFDNGRILLISGSKGMAGAAILNIIGATSVGTGYIHSLVEETIYPIVASNQIETVYHVDDLTNSLFVDNLDLYDKIDAIGFGSGLNNHPFAKDYLKQILTNFKKPVIVDAYGLSLLANDDSLYTLNDNLIITPHMGEFMKLTGFDKSVIEADKINIARKFASDHNLTLVLKGPKTLVICKDKTIYENNSGNACLAKAGSGDVLTGMITGMCALYKNNPHQAVIDAVWLHGHIGDMHAKTHSKQIFDLKTYPQYADMFLRS